MQRFFSRLMAASVLAVMILPAIAAEYQLTCNSNNYRYNNCAVNNVNGNYRVHLTRQTSRSNCVEGQTWGRDGRGIWVDRGCSGTFTVSNNDGYGGGRRHRRWSQYDNQPNYSLQRSQGISNRNEYQLTCSSRNYNRSNCRFRNPGGRYQIYMVNQNSRSQCVRGTSWDQDENGIWVDKGCSATFNIVQEDY